MKKITNLCMLLMLLFMSKGLLAQNVLTVSSDQDSGAGSLRQLIADATAGDSIVIPGGYTIVINSEITFDKDLKINGQGATVKVVEPGVSNWRVFTLGISTSTAKTVRFYDLNMQGGNITGNGGTVFVNQNHTFSMKNCSVSKGKGVYVGGLMINSATGTSVNLENCTFSENEGTTNNGGACILKGNTVVKNCVFSNNTVKQNGAAIAAYSQTLIENCTFINNTSNGTTGSAVINYAGATGSVDLANCTFESNSHVNATNGVAGFAIANSVANSTLTNCTFYKNSGQTSGAIWNNKGNLKLINCTFAGNTTLSSNGGAFNNTNHADAKTTIVNCILTHNYNSGGLMDLSMGALGTVAGGYNIVGAVTGTPGYTNSVSFSYSPASDLYNAYTATGNLMPILANNGGATKTIALSNTSIANGAGTATFGDPNIVPTTDQRGISRATAPSIGAYEYKVPTGTTTSIGPKFRVYPNPASEILYLDGEFTINSLEIIDLSGKKVLSIEHPANTISLDGISQGLYILKILSAEGQTQMKITIR
ncbi:MAG: choice-of-anchor Q domain-containing protein [Paludibacter sp.]|nr:choice-of-anchor Q domain-containing protein [Paludibacter sp.]